MAAIERAKKTCGQMKDEVEINKNSKYHCSHNVNELDDEHLPSQMREKMAKTGAMTT